MTDNSGTTNPIGFRSLVDQLHPHHHSTLGNCLTTTIPDHWRQGRTAYGGVMTGLALGAAQHASVDLLNTSPPLPSLRSVSINFIGPVIGQPLLQTHLLRQGRNVISLRSDIFSIDHPPTSTTQNKPDESPLVCTANLVFGADRPAPLAIDHQAPPAPKPDQCDDLIPEAFKIFAPNYLKNFDIRTIEGDPPLSGSQKNGYSRCWVRHLDPKSRTHTDSFLCLADVLFPAAMPMLTQISAVSSISWLVNIIHTPTTQEGWWQVETKLTATHNGYSSQIMRYWNSENILVAEAIQNVAIFT